MSILWRGSHSNGALGGQCNSVAWVGFRAVVGLRRLLIVVGLSVVESEMYMVMTNNCDRVGAIDGYVDKSRL